MEKFWIFSTGTELTRGYSKDTNSSEIAQSLVENGFDIAGISLIPDDKELLIKNFNEKLNDNIAGIIITGGLGPTEDDHTIDVLSKITNLEVIEDTESFKRLEKISKKIKRIDINTARRQVRVLQNSIVLKNEVGLAPGMIIEYKNKIIVSLPGVPMEMRSMLPNVINYLNQKFPKKYYEKFKFYIYNEPESEFQKNYEKIKESLSISFNWGISANPGYLKVFIENSNPEYKNQFDLLLEKIRQFYKDKFLETPIEQTIQNLMIQNKKTLVCCESCTGGFLGKILTDIPGSSEYFLGSMVVYSNKAKMIFLNVKEETLKQFGAVSKECATEMVEGLIKKIHADYGISITGIAGPGGGTKEKPVGTVYIGIKTPEKTIIHKIFYPSTRERIREYTIYTALYFLYKELKNDFTKNP
ncbi:MAG: CinA-like protein [Leptospiraceae bacterium]|nr:MAG: CinA-like protein [Leptospiraceae bacterium]